VITPRPYQEIDAELTFSRNMSRKRSDGSLVGARDGTSLRLHRNKSF
jgi:hypothetical protein